MITLHPPPPAWAAASLTAALSSLSADDPVYRRCHNAAPITITLDNDGSSIAGREFYFEQGNWGRVTFALPGSMPAGVHGLDLPDLALPILNGVGSVVRVVMTNAGRWRIDEITPDALMRTDKWGYHPVQDAGLKFWGEGLYGVQQTRLTQSDTTRVTHWPCRAGCADYLRYVGTDPSSGAMPVIADAQFPGGYALRQRTSAGGQGYLTSTYTPSSKQYLVVEVMRVTTTGTTGMLFRLNAADTHYAGYANVGYQLQPIPITGWTTAALQVGNDGEGIGTVTVTAGAAVFTHPQDEHLALYDYILIAGTAYQITARSSATAWTVSPANTVAANPFVRRPGMERTIPRTLIWGSSQEGGTASSGSATTLVHTGKLWPTNRWANATVRITAGTGSGQSAVVSSNTATTLTVPAASFSPAPDATSVYRIESAQTFVSNQNGISEMMSPSSLNNQNVATELTFTGGWALNLYAVLIFDGQVANLPALKRWLDDRFPFTKV